MCVTAHFVLGGVRGPNGMGNFHGGHFLPLVSQKFYFILL